MDRPPRGDESYESAPSVRGRDIRSRFAKACAIVHGRGYKMSANDLMELVYEEGLPTRAERERILAEKLAEDDEGDNTTPFSSPG